MSAVSKEVQMAITYSGIKIFKDITTHQLDVNLIISQTPDRAFGNKHV